MLNRVWTMLEITRAIRMDGRKIAMVRNLAMMPSVMSTLTEVEVPSAPPKTYTNRSRKMR
ncbi:hypothetical protein [Acrocarpospora corrugata]|nr:hypothetical protein [Acrocarpospora corrugata]